MSTSPLLGEDAAAAGAAAAGAAEVNRERREARRNSGSGIHAGSRSTTPSPRSAGSGPCAGSGSTPMSATTDEQAHVHGRRNKCWPLCPEWMPLGEKETSVFLSKTTDTAVMGLFTLVTFSATYLLAWGKPGTNCIPPLKYDGNGGLVNSDPSWPQFIVGLLPFIVLPIGLYSSSLAKIGERDKRVLNWASTICLSEFIFTVVLGATMIHCMGGLPADTALYIVTMVVVCLTVLMWRLMFQYPKFLCKRRGEADKATPGRMAIEAPAGTVTVDVEGTPGRASAEETGNQ